VPTEAQWREDEAKGSFSREDYRLVSYLIDNPEIPDKIRRMFWAFASRAMALTNLDVNDVKRIMYDWKDAKLTYMMSIPQYEFTFDQQLALSNFESVLFAVLKRSTGGMQRERFIIGAQITQRIGQSDTAPSGGLIGTARKVLGMG